MIEYHSVSVRLSDPELDKVNPPAKVATAITLRLLLEMIGTDETNFPIIFF